VGIPYKLIKSNNNKTTQMKYVITGGAGHISKPLTEKLLAAGHNVTVIGRNQDHLKDLVAKGAKAEIGSLEDEAFLTKAFGGADAIYTMVPNNFAITDLNGYFSSFAKKYAAALKASKIKYVVNLSSMGAHMPEGAGPVSGLHLVEESLNKLTDTNVLHLRPAYFYYNFLGQAAMAKQMNIIGSNFGSNEKLVMTDPADIAEVAADALLKLDFTGKSVKYIASDERSVDDIARVLGSAIGKPDLKWIEFTDEEAFGGMVQAGLPEPFAKSYSEMGHALKTGEMSADYWQHRPQLSKKKLEHFAAEFAAAYNSN
jgi:uncharacterized protein YbjT (DUF2867 family)